MGVVFRCTTAIPRESTISLVSGCNMKPILINSVKGTRDFYPEDMAVRTWLYKNVRDVSESYGYQEWEGPLIESISLYAAKSGEELVKEQAFVFEDRGGDLLTLRPELTPTLARMVAQRQRELVYPFRWWSFGPFWRYERPQKGRTREFFQWNIDLIGSDTAEADAELIAICASFFERVGLNPSQVKININNRRLMDHVLEKMSVQAENKKDVFRLIDRKDKMSLPDWRSYAVDLGLQKYQIDALLDVLDDDQLWQQSSELRSVFATLDAMGVSTYVKFDPQVIRGLDYYTGTVFEARDEDGGRAILGGGRYDNLVADVGGEPLPGVGFAMGDVMMTVILKKYNKLPQMPRTPASILVTVFDEERVLESQALAAELRGLEISAQCYPGVAKLPKQLKYADRIGVPFAAILGPDEIASQKVTLKDLRARSQQTIDRSRVGEVIKNWD